MYRGLKMILLFAAALPASLTGAPPDINHLLDLVRQTPATAGIEAEAQ